jgi:hypothetical protein
MPHAFSPNRRIRAIMKESQELKDFVETKKETNALLNC